MLQSAEVRLTGILLLLGILISAQTTQAFDKYQDALEKYRRWQERYTLGSGSKDNFIRVQRQTKLKPAANSSPQRDRVDDFVLKNVIPQEDDFVTKFVKSSNLDKAFNNVIEESEVNFVRPARAPSSNILYTQGGPGSEYIHSSGVPLYKIRNRYPHGYGRKKRSADPQPQGWTILDPLTGRPVDVAIELPAVNRRQRQPQNPQQQAGEDGQFVAAPGSEYIHSSGQPLYKIRQQYPLYGRKKRSANPQGWTILDPLTGRPKDTSLEIPAVLRRERQPLDENVQNPLLETVSRQLTEAERYEEGYKRYKYYQRHPYSG